MTEDREADIRLTISNLISEHDDKLFAAFDQLHKKDIHDDDINKALWSLGAAELAEGYVDWMNDGEPVRADEDGPLDQGEELVTDPGDAPSYSGLIACAVDESGGLDEALGTERGDRESWPATPGELTAELTAAGINATNLEQGLIDAYNANRINHGIFFAERSNDGVHWHVYKKRNHEDNGAYIATANDRDGAAFILHSLGTGTVEGQ